MWMWMKTTIENLLWSAVLRGIGLGIRFEDLTFHTQALRKRMIDTGRTFIVYTLGYTLSMAGPLSHPQLPLWRDHTAKRPFLPTRNFSPMQSTSAYAHSPKSNKDRDAEPETPSRGLSWAYRSRCAPAVPCGRRDPEC